MLKKEAKCLIVGRPCPKNGDPAKGDYCPKWWREVRNKEVKEGCGEEMLPRYLTALYEVSERAAVEASSLKNDARGIIERKLDDALAAMPAFVRQVVQRMWVPQAVDQIQYAPPDHERPKVTFQDPENRC